MMSHNRCMSSSLDLNFSGFQPSCHHLACEAMVSVSSLAFSMKDPAMFSFSHKSRVSNQNMPTLSSCSTLNCAIQTRFDPFQCAWVPGVDAPQLSVLLALYKIVIFPNLLRKITKSSFEQTAKGIFLTQLNSLFLALTHFL